MPDTPSQLLAVVILSWKCAHAGITDPQHKRESSPFIPATSRWRESNQRLLMHISNTRDLTRTTFRRRTRGASSSASGPLKRGWGRMTFTRESSPNMMSELTWTNAYGESAQSSSSLALSNSAHTIGWSLNPRFSRRVSWKHGAIHS